MTSSEDSEHGQQYIGMFGAMSDEEGSESSEEDSDRGIEYVGMNPLAGCTDEDAHPGLTASTSIDFV